MKPTAAWGTPATIRVRLLAALTIALLPVLALGVVQSILAFSKDEEVRSVSLRSAAERSATIAVTRIESGAVVLDTLSSQTTGLQCAQRLSQIVDRSGSYSNLVRYDRFGLVVCAARGADSAGARQSGWFRRLEQGEKLSVVLPDSTSTAPRPLIAAVRTERDGAFDGAMMAEIPLNLLRPSLADPSLPPETEVALADAHGRFVSWTDMKSFPARPETWVRKASNDPELRYGKDAAGRDRVFATAPLVGSELYVILSAPSQGVLPWARVNVLSSIIPPLMAFILALAAVWVVTEQVVVRWLHYLQRVALLYARGRFTVRSVQASSAPPEIRELASTLDMMADAIVARDQSLHESLAHKDDLMREIHHRVKNNLQVISSLINMQQRALTDPMAKLAMADTRQRVSAIALVYRALYQGADLRQVDLTAFLEELTGQLVAPEGAGDHSVRTVVHADDLIIDPDKLAPLALFAVEAISNARKHAFAGHGGDLSIRFTVDGAEARLEIADAPPAPGNTPPSLGDGMGRTLMTAFARQLGGRAEFEANSRGGLTAMLIFPTPGEVPRPAQPPTRKLKRNSESV